MSTATRCASYCIDDKHYFVVFIFRRPHVLYAGNCGDDSTWNTWYRSSGDPWDWSTRCSKRSDKRDCQKGTRKWKRIQWMATVVLLEQRPLTSLPILVSCLMHIHCTLPTCFHVASINPNTHLLVMNTNMYGRLPSDENFLFTLDRDYCSMSNRHKIDLSRPFPLQSG